jgi:hypothetical protein
MADNSQFLESLMTTVFRPAVEGHHHHDALVAAILVYLLSPDEKQKQDAAGLVCTSASVLLEQWGVITKSCLFCGDKPPKVRLGATAAKVGEGKERVVYFCERCVNNLQAVFS